MLGSIRQFFEEELKTRTDSWHFRWYNYWRKKGGRNKRDYRENFCHYMRVLLFWAPLKWFLYANVFEVVRPCTTMLTASALSFIGVASYFWPIEVLKVFLVIIVAVAAVVVFFFLLIRFAESDLSDRLMVWIERHEKQLGLSILGIIVAVYGTLIGILIYEHPLEALIVFACIVGLVVLIILMLLTAIFAKMRLEERNERRAAQAAGQPATIEAQTGPINAVLEGTRLVGKFILASKHRACPFMTFVDKRGNAVSIE